MKLPKAQKGVALILLLIIIGALAIGGGLYLKSRRRIGSQQGSQGSSNSQSSSGSTANYLQIMKNLGCTSPSSCKTTCQKPGNSAKCQALLSQFGMPGLNGGQNPYPSRNDLPTCSGNAVLSHAPADPSTYQYITPLGNVSASSRGASHVVPTDHIYFSNSPLNIPILSEAQAVALLETIPVYSPGDIRIVEVDAKTYTDSTHGVTSKDYSIYFSPCKDVVFYFHHITAANPVITSALDKITNKQCGSQPLDNFILESCNYYNTSIDLKVGDKIGLGAFDFGVFDFRQQPSAFIDQSKATTLYAACPLDYFTEPAKTQMYKNVVNAKLNASGLPDCGTNMQDVPNTIQGNWYLPSAGNQNQGSVQNTSELSIIHLNTDPSIGVIAWGGAIATSNQLHFAPTSNGTINREPYQVAADGQIYCYQATPELRDITRSGLQYQPNAHILLQLTDGKTLKVEYSQGFCPSSPSFSSPTIYIR